MDTSDTQGLRETRFAMRLSLAVGLLMLLGKVTAYFLTHSAAIFSDAAESVVHVVAVVFAAFSLRLSAKPAAANSCMAMSGSRSSRQDLRER
jgi:divalent metal cation (Fe/Co/Zn/Cd) transporter